MARRRGGERLLTLGNAHLAIKRASEWTPFVLKPTARLVDVFLVLRGAHRAVLAVAMGNQFDGGEQLAGVAVEGSYVRIERIDKTCRERFTREGFRLEGLTMVRAF